MKKIILTAIISLVSALGCLAYDFAVDGLKYTITNLKNPSTVKIVGLYSAKTTSVVVPEVVTYAGVEFTVEDNLPLSIFQGSQYLSKVEFRRKITELPQAFFYGCSYLVKVEGIENVNSIGEECFGNCTNMTDFPIFNNVTRIERGSFAGSGIRDLSVFPNVTAIGEAGFMECKNLRSIPALQHLEEMGVKAFWECKSLEEIATLPNLLQIGDSALDIRNLKEIPSFPKLKKIEGALFANLGLTEFPDFPSLEWIGMKAFEGNDFEELNLSSVESVNPYAFRNCKKLKKVILKNAIFLSNEAFGGCSSLETVEIPKIEYIVEGCFENCINLKEIKVGDSLKQIWARAFKNCENLSTFPYSSGLTHILDNAFENCGITEVRLNNGLEYIGREAFKGAFNVESISVPGSVTYLGDDCFQGMVGVKSLTFEPGEPLNGAVVESGSSQWMSLEKVDIRRDVEWCGFTPTTEEEYNKYLSFPKCYSSSRYSNLKEVRIHNIKETYPAPFVGLNANVIIDCEYMKVPPAKALYEETKYDEAGFWDGEEWVWKDNSRIERYESFLNVLKRVTLGPNMKGVWAECFHDVKELRCLAINPPALLKGNFTNMTYLKTELYVPEESLSAYQNAPGWSDFFIIKPIPADELSGVEEIAVSENPCEPEYYDLTGRRVTSPEKGIYIVKDSRGVRKVIL